MSDSRKPGQSRAISRLPWTRVRLTPVERSDAEQFHVWHNDPYLRDVNMAWRLPVSRERVEEWISGLGGERARSRVFYGIRLDDKLVGYALLDNIDPVQRVAALGVTVADSSLRAFGVGHVAGAVLLDFAFRGLDLRRVEVEAMAANVGTIRGVEHLGFIHEGTRRKAYYVGGMARDTRTYGLLREEFLLWPPAEANLLVSRFDD